MVFKFNEELKMMPCAEEWLDNEDTICREKRLKRLKWIMEQYPKIDNRLFYGGIKSYYLFEEARYCLIKQHFFCKFSFYLNQ